MAPRPQSATKFHALHKEEHLLILANAWDAGSARLIESLGAKAIATTSAGLAWSRGYADGNHLPIDVHVRAIEEIARVITVPLSADIEAGYSDDPKIVAENIAQIIDAGAVGINIEDGASDPALLCAKIEGVRNAAERVGIDLYINARTDVYLRKLVPSEKAVDEVIARAARYQTAGASGIFVPGLTDAAAIREIASGTAALPLNVMVLPGLPQANELEALGVRRLSAGGAIARAALAQTRLVAEKFLATGISSDEFFAANVPTHAAMNQLFAERS